MSIILFRILNPAARQWKPAHAACGLLFAEFTCR